MKRKNRLLPILIVLLLATAYFADWSDDYNSYWNASRWRAFQVANGVPATLSSGGGGYDALPALFASHAMTERSANKRPGYGQQDSSVLNAVFGDPMGDPSSSNTSTAGDGSTRLSMQGNAMRMGDQRSAFGSMNGSSSNGSMNGMSMGAASYSGFGQSASGLGLLGSSSAFGGNE